MKRDKIVGSSVTVPATHFTSDAVVQRREAVCAETVCRVSLNGAPVAALIATAQQLRELGAGFVITEGLARTVHTVDVQDDRIAVTGDAAEPGEAVQETSGGPSFMGGTLPGATSPITITTGDVFRVITEIVSELWQNTGGAHCSVLFSQGTIVARSSDVGRHNTVDKVIGHAILNGIDPGQCVLGCTGRQPAGMVRKAANAGIPVIVSKAATTAEGAALANAAGITLICRVKDASFSVYSHRWRVVEIGVGENEMSSFAH